MSGPTNQPTNRSLLIGLVAVIAIAGVIYLFLHALAASDKAIVTTGITVIASMITLAYQRSHEQQKVIEEQRRVSKVKVYETFLKFWFDLLMRSRLGKKPVSEREMSEFFSAFTQELILWGSDQVVVEYSNFRKINFATDQPKIMLSQFEILLKAIRADIGHKNTGIQEGVLSSLFLSNAENDSDDHASIPTKN